MELLAITKILFPASSVVLGQCGAPRNRAFLRGLLFARLLYRLRRLHHCRGFLEAEGGPQSSEGGTRGCSIPF